MSARKASRKQNSESGSMWSKKLIRFLKADTTFMNMRPLRYSFLFDSHTDSLPVITSSFARRGLVSTDAIMSSYHHKEVKFTEPTLETFRMLQCLEWEPSGSFSTRNETDNSHSGAGINRVNLFQDIRS